MATLAEIRAKLKEQESNSGGNRGPTDNAIFPFWNMKENETATVRFLPDADPTNDFFWVERLMIKLPFAGIKGDTDSRPVIVQVPCMEMYGESCPILAEVRGWFKDPAMEDMGRKYWKKRSYVFQHLVIDSDLSEDKPASPIRRSILGPQIFQIVKEALLDPELEDLPTDYANGLDFVIKKTSKGNFADYSTSKWSRRERALTAEENAAVEEHGLYTLGDYKPKQPGATEIEIIKQMFEASVDGEAYDQAKFGQYFRPAGMSQATGDPNMRKEAITAPVPKSAAATNDDIPFEVDEKVAKIPEATPKAEAPAAGGGEDILAMIRKRQS
jgi:hypothetical protein|tara:strand:- start:13373 stop:14356 length:984 start_codon:yes stop_codon:yes gene_type:complete